MKKLFLTTALLALIASPAVAATVTAELRAVARVGVDLPTVLGFNVGGNVQLGRNLEAATSSVVANNAVIKGGDYNLYGAEVNVSRALVAGITGDVGYRYRNGIESKGLDNQETRLNAGLSYEILPSYKIGVEYYRYSRAINPATGTKLFSQVALKLGHSF